MATLLKALIAGVPTLIDSQTVARSMVSDTNGAGALSSGDLISAKGGTIARADAATSKWALGYVAAAVLASAAFSYFIDGVNSNSSGLTKGEPVILGAAGAATTTPTEPSSGQGYQEVGYAVSATAFSFVPGPGYTRA